MPKFKGAVGFAETVETSPGIHVEKITTRRYSCDLLRNNRNRRSLRSNS